MITVFKNLSETWTPHWREPHALLERIRNGSYKEKVEEVRSCKDPKKRGALKKKLPWICWSGRFQQRSGDHLLEHSGLICLDFDKLPADDMPRLRSKLVADPYTFALFTSPSGFGLKVLVKIPADPLEHKAHFDALAEYYNEPSFDTVTSDVARACYASFDPDLYHNPDSEQWTKKKERDFYHMADRVPEIRLRSSNEIVRRLMKWWTGKYGLVEGQRNHNTFILAATLNDFGVPQLEARGVLMDLVHEGFEEREVMRILESAYSKRENFGTRYFEDTEIREEIQRKLIAGQSKTSIHRDLIERLPEADIEKAIDLVERSSPWIEFWKTNPKTGGIKVVNHRFKAWLEHHGFRKLYPERAENFVFVKVEDNLIGNTTDDAMKDHVLKHLHSKVPNIAVFEHMAGATRFFKEDYLSMLEPIEASFVDDAADHGMLYYRNCAVRVTDRKIEAVDYLDLDGYVWRKHIVDREWNMAPERDSVFKRFVRHLSGDNNERELSLRTTIGYLLHSYKSSANNRAVILNDETISENPNGGSGKGLLCQGISHMKRVAVLDGKVFSPDKSFPYQTVGADTQVLVFDDVDKYFRFERLFSLITEGITLEKKNKDAVRLPVSRSPKIIITTNYTVGGVGGSFERRKWEVELSSYFSAKHTPLDEFGHMLFDDWDVQEWARFDRYMVGCLQLYLAHGLVASAFHNLGARKLIKETSHEFVEWATEGNLEVGVRHDRGERYQRFTDEYPDYKEKGKHGISRKRFTQWMAIWGQHHRYDMSEGRDQAGNRWTMYTVTNGHATAAAAAVDPLDEAFKYRGDDN